jgi:general secretion pathway protein D
VLKSRTLAFSVIAVSLFVSPLLWAQDKKPTSKKKSLDDVVLELTLDRDEKFKVDEILQSWGVNLGHIVIADSKIMNREINLLTRTNKISWRVFKKILQMNDVAIVEQEIEDGQILIKALLKRDIPNVESPPFPITTDDRLPDRADIVTALIQIEHGAGSEIYQNIRGILNQDRSRAGEIIHIRGPEVILVTDFAPNVQYYRKIIKALDVRAPGQVMRLRRLEFAIPSEISQVLSQLFSSQDQARPEGFRVAVNAQISPPLFVAHDPTGKLIMRAYSYQFEEIERLIAELDVRVKEETGKFHVYKCQNSNAEVLAEKLQELFSNQLQSRSNTGTTIRQGNNNRNNNRNNRGGLGGRNTGAAGQQSGAPRQIDTRIVADQRTNSLLIQAEEDEYQSIRRLLRQLDKKRRRVFIEAMVWEISANDDLTIATELAALSNPHQGSLRPLAATSFGLSDLSITENGIGRDVVNRLQQGVTAVLTKDTFDRVPVILNVLQSHTQSKRITTPFAITNDNDTATFRVSNSQPFNTTTVNNVASQQNVQFVDATSNLTIQPQVNSNDNLTLDVELVISSFGARPSPTLPPATSSREYRGRVTVPNGKYIVFGGFDRQGNSIVESKVPFLGDIPYLGHIFKQWRRTVDRTKVYVFIRPVIFFDENFRDDIRATSFLREKAHRESEREDWLPPMVADPKARKGKLQDKVFELFGTGSANPFDN